MLEFPKEMNEQARRKYTNSGKPPAQKK